MSFTVSGVGPPPYLAFYPKPATIGLRARPAVPLVLALSAALFVRLRALDLPLAVVLRAILPLALLHTLLFNPLGLLVSLRHARNIPKDCPP